MTGFSRFRNYVKLPSPNPAQMGRISDVKLISVVKQTLTRDLFTPSDSASIAIRKKNDKKTEISRVKTRPSSRYYSSSRTLLYSSNRTRN